MEGHVDSSEWHGSHSPLKLDRLGLCFGGVGALVECIEYAGTNLLFGLSILENRLEVRLTALEFADQ